ncbi:hypothetical protein [Fodinibius halophilus]|uniref:Outer membrane beta-barrel protein n=1 Tax=Fodinibius halophilus TaxID=1736908 RepID=A0A6M1T733_9BACT|nr:hypothetical protein [Fodinibius halophilus]NGP89145.1 hypothetical protein [Fodinibius halophilus]
MIKQVFESIYYYFGIVASAALLIVMISHPVSAQSGTTPNQDDQFESLRSDVGIHGLTANIHQLSDLTYKGNSDSLTFDNTSELEFVYRNVRMMSQRLGVGYQLMTSFYTGGDDSGFGVGSWGLGPVIRAYPFRSDQVQPYAQFNSMFGNNLGLSRLANTQDLSKGFRVRFGVRAGLAVRIANSFGLFTEVGYDWESSRIFRADSRAFQANVGFDFYLFN